MKRQRLTFTFMKQLLILLVFAQCVFAQGYNEPLTMQGIDHTILHSAASRAMGGTIIGIRNQAALMFSNPASLQSVKAPQISLTGFNQNLDASQVQQYSPLKYYSNYSLLMEGLTGYISNPDTSLPASEPGDTVQRPFDNIGPNWSKSKNSGLRGEVFLALPFSVSEMNFTVGLGVTEYANLYHHYENQNVLSPSVGGERPVPVARPASDSVPFITHWSSFTRSRDGFIHGYGAVFSGAITEELSFGLSGMILSGTTNDYEQSTARGMLTFYRDWFRLDSTYGHLTKTGTSDYSGAEFTLCGI